MQVNYGRSGVSMDVSFFLENPEEWNTGGIEKRRKSTKFKRDRNFPTRHKSQMRDSHAQ